MEIGNKTFDKTFNEIYKVSSGVVRHRVLVLKTVVRW